MGIIRRSQQAFSILFIEIPARAVGIDHIIHRLEKSGQVILKSAGRVNGRPGNQDAMIHIIGIERWGQRRLRVALGEPLDLDEYDPYRPDTCEWQRLVAIFHAVRQDTISLSKSLRMASVDPKMRIPHNQWGELSLLGWLFYLNIHARVESLRLN